MINDEQLKQILTIKKQVFEIIEESLKTDGHCKSYEGAIDIMIQLPSYHDDSDAIKYTIALHCYLLGGKRHYHYSGYTIQECIEKLEKDIALWKQGEYEEYDDDRTDFMW